MPRYDKTGPAGFGPATGRGLGPCGRGFRQRAPLFHPLQRLTKKEELAILNEEAAIVQEELKEIKQRISELEGRK